MHLQAALQALYAADQAMRASATPDVAVVNGDLEAALRELHSFPGHLSGKRKTILDEIQGAISRMNQSPPNPAAVGMTDEAITNVRTYGR